MTNINFITTGGTIGSVLTPGSVSIDMSERRIACEIEKAKTKLGCSVSVKSVFNKNSEDLCPSDWVHILNAIYKANEDDSGGIIVTHGTDTMVYSVFAAVIFSNLWKKKVCFTGSYIAPDVPYSDAPLNLLAALEFCISSHPASGVYVAFRSNKFNSEAKIIHGAHLKSMDFDSLYFDSAYNQEVASYNPKSGLSNNISLSSVDCPHLGSKRLPSISNIVDASKEVAYISIYPGIDKDTLESIAKRKRILILKLYHSGTAPTTTEYSDILDFASSSLHNTMIFAGTFPKDNILVPYDSTIKLIESNFTIYSDLQTEFLYTFSVLGLSLGMSPTDIAIRLSRHRLSL